MSGADGKFGFPKNGEQLASSADCSGEHFERGTSSGAASKDAVARSIASDLKRLNRSDVVAEREALDAKYERLQRAYAHGLQLREVEEVRLRFFSLDVWEEYRGHKPESGRHGPDDGMRFSVMLVFGGSEERQKEASMFANACWAMAHRGTREEDFLHELRNGGGPKRWASVAAEIRRQEGQQEQPAREQADRRC